MIKARQSAPTQSPPSIEQVRQRARHRLIGVAVLVLAGVVAFPLVFESQPRPIPVDIPIEIPSRKAVKPLTVESSASAGEKLPVEKALGDDEEVVASSAVAAKPEPGASRPGVAVPAAPAPAAKAVASAPVAKESPAKEAATKEPVAKDATIAKEAAKPAPKEVAKEPAKEAPKPKDPPKDVHKEPAKEAPKDVTKDVAKEAPKPVKEAPKEPAKDTTKEAAKEPAKDSGKDAARAQALLEGKAVPVDAKSAAPAASGERFIVQVGAFAEAEAARQTRLKLEHAGLKTYTHVAELPEGKRIRVRLGPFATRAEADKAAAKAKGLGLAAAILTL